MSEELCVLNGGMQAVVSQLAALQVVYLDFDGANASYRNAELGIAIDNVTVEASGFDSATVSVIVDALNGQFGDDVVFTSELPSEGDFSTIYVGVTSAFDEYGTFHGLAETIDSGNQIRDDNAFVLLDSSAPTQMVVSVIAHETEHIVHGMDHGGDGLRRYAENYEVGSGQIRNGIILNEREKMFVYNGGQVTNTTVNSGGSMAVFSGGTADCTTVNGGCVMSVYSSAKATNTTVNGGRMTVQWGGMTYITSVTNDALMWVYSGCIASNTTINDSGVMYMSGGTAIITSVTNGGSMRIGGTATSTTVSGASMLVYGNGTADITTVSDGGMFIHDEGTAKNTTLNGGLIGVWDGGAASITTVNIGEMFVISNATATSTTVNSVGSMCVYSGGTANITTVNIGGNMSVYSGGIANNTINAFGNMSVYGGGIANITTVSGGGNMSVFSGGTAASTTVVGGIMSVYGGGTANSTTIAQGANFGYMFVLSGGTANDTTVNAYYTAISGLMIVSEGGVANRTTLRGGAMNVLGGVANSTFVINGGVNNSMKGSLAVKSGTAKNTTVYNGGQVFISSGGTHGGMLLIADGGIVSAYSGAVIDFTVAEQKARGTALINRYDYITGETPSFTITVSGGEADGRYALAGNASAFNSTVTVKTTSGTALGTLTVGGSVISGKTIYSLAIDNQTLFLDVMTDLTPPTVSELTVGTPDKDGKAAVSIVPSEELSKVLYSWNGGEWTELPVGEPLTVSEKGTVRFQLTDKVGNVGTTEEYKIDAYSIDVKKFEYQTDGNNAVIDWSGDATYIWSRDYDVRLLSNAGVVAMDRLATSGLELLNLPTEEMMFWVKPGRSDEWTAPFSLDMPEASGPAAVSGVENGMAEAMFARGSSVWGGQYVARHVGGGWSGARPEVALAGRNVLGDIFIGSDDATLLLLTDDANGDAVFLEDVCSAFPDGVGVRARVAKIDELRAGAGDDVVDLTSSRFSHVGGGMTVRGGLGDDVIWAAGGNNMLFGDAGDDWIVGSAGNDIIVGGIGDDRLHGGGGGDLFCFCADWGRDTVEQFASGSVTLWFEEGDESKWDRSSLTYADGDNSVTVTGVASVTLLFGGADGRHASLLAAGAFDAFTSEKIFEGTLA